MGGRFLTQRRRGAEVERRMFRVSGFLVSGLSRKERKERKDSKSVLATKDTKNTRVIFGAGEAVAEGVLVVSG